MIRVYLDWNVISSLKKPEFKVFNDFIKENKEKLLFPYSPAHFSDLMKSYSPSNVHFNKDLDNLNFLAGKHLIRWNKENFEPLFGTPEEYFKQEKESINDQFTSQFENFDFEKLIEILDACSKDLGVEGLGGIVKMLFENIPAQIPIHKENDLLLSKMLPKLNENSNMWDVVRDYSAFSKKLLNDKNAYKDLRDSISQTGLRLEANSGNWNEEDVISNIDRFLSSKNVSLTFDQFVRLGVNAKDGSETLYDYYIYAFVLLDILGYKADKLPKPTDNLQNIQTDAEHSFYGACCDYFVAIDKKLRAKTKALFSKYHIGVQVVTPEEFLQSVVQDLYFQKEVTSDFFTEALEFFKRANTIETIPFSEKCRVDSHVIKLPIFYFDFFNYAIFQHYESEGVYGITFKKVNNGYSNFLFYTELENLFDKLVGFFFPNQPQKFEIEKQQFIYDIENSFVITWQFDHGIIRLEKDPDNGKPVLIYVYRIPAHLQGEVIIGTQ